MKTLRILIIAVFSITLLYGCKKTPNVEKTNGFIGHQQFMRNIETALPASFLKHKKSKVLNKVEFMRIKNHIINTYKGTVIINSFIMNKVGYIDCIKINTQPSLNHNGTHTEVADIPPASLFSKLKTETKARPIAPMLGKNKRDRFGNPMFCRKGSIPMRRITLEELTRFETLDDFFNKYGQKGAIPFPNGKIK